MSQVSPPQQDKPRWTAVSIALCVIGLLILLPAGLCTVLVAAEESADSELLLLILAFGGVPMGAGAALIYAGLKIHPRDGQMAPNSPPGQKAPHWTAASIALLVLGLLILVPSGLCTALVGGSIVVEGLANADFSGVFIVLLSGAVPLAIGAALVYAALKMRRQG